MPRKIDRLLEYLRYKGITENKATVDCGLSNGLIGQAKRGKSDLGEKALDKILIKYQDLDRVWLLTGQGAMLKEAAAPAVATAPAGPAAVQSDMVSIPREVWEIIRAQAERLDRKDKQVDELLAMLREERGDVVDDLYRAASRAAAD